MKRIMWYLKGTTDYGIVYTKENTDECIGYSDADWGGDLEDRKSTSGYLFVISGGSVSWVEQEAVISGPLHTESGIYGSGQLSSRSSMDEKTIGRAW